MSNEEKTTATVAAADLRTGAELKGKVKQIELYGAFVDVGIGQDGLLHISQLGKPNVRNVEEVVKVGDEITVYVLKVHDTGRVALTMVKPPAVSWDALDKGSVVRGKVVRIEKFGVFVDIGAERPGMVHVSELAEGYVKTPEDVVRIGDEVEARVIKLDRKKRQIDLSLKPIPEPIEIIEEPEDDSDTAMAVAFRKAMAGEPIEADEDNPYMRRKQHNKKSNRREKRRDDEREDIFLRTLRGRER